MRIIHQVAIKSVRKFVFAFFLLDHDDDYNEENKNVKRVSHNLVTGVRFLPYLQVC